MRRLTVCELVAITERFRRQRRTENATQLMERRVLGSTLSSAVLGDRHSVADGQRFQGSQSTQRGDSDASAVAAPTVSASTWRLPRQRCATGSGERESTPRTSERSQRSESTPPRPTRAPSGIDRTALGRGGRRGLQGPVLAGGLCRSARRRRLGSSPRRSPTCGFSRRACRRRKRDMTVASVSTPKQRPRP